MRIARRAALGAAVLALLVSACSSGGSSQSPGSQSIASQLVLGGPRECPQRPYCLPGLEETYGLTFKEFKPLDVGGPLTVEAIKSGQVDVGVLFTSDPAIAVNDFVLLDDDKQLQESENLVPVVRQDVLDASPAVADLLNDIMGRLTQPALTSLNKQVTVDGATPAEAAKGWLEAEGILPGAGGSGAGRIVVGSTNFYEQEILGELFAQALEANGFDVDRKFQLGNREIVFPALRSGEIDILPEYLASALTVAYEGTASTDPAETASSLEEALAADDLALLDYASATDQNGFVVTRETASTYGLATVSDLGKPAP